MHSKFSPPPIQVFISFRGAQLRNSFISHLVAGLRRHGINVFIDNQENKGEPISNLFKRIDESRIAIVVFSSRFTESDWCLKEAEKIMEREVQDMLKVLPIFYKVTTNQVKQFKGEFGDNFRDLEYKYRNNRFVIDKWMEAVAFISHIFGLEFDEKSSESDFITLVVDTVLTMLESFQMPKQTLKSQVIESSEAGESSKSIVTFPKKKLMTQQPRGGDSSTPQASVGGYDVSPDQYYNSTVQLDMDPSDLAHHFSYKCQFGPNEVVYEYSTTGHTFPTISTEMSYSPTETNRSLDYEVEDWSERLM